MRLSRNLCNGVVLRGQPRPAPLVGVGNWAFIAQRVPNLKRILDVVLVENVVTSGPVN